MVGDDQAIQISYMIPCALENDIVFQGIKLEIWYCDNTIS